MKQTDSLRQELMESPDLDRFLSENAESFEEEGCGEALQSILDTKDYSKAELARRSGMSTVYLHQLFSGYRKPSRDRLICLCFGLECSLDVTQDLLKKSGFLSLYPKNRRDAIIIYALTRGLSLQETNDKLFQENEETLF